MGNMDFYNKYKKPPQNALKNFNNGKFSGTDINPMWRIMVLTEHFGMCGFGWYSEVLRVWNEKSSDSTVTVFVECALYVKVDGEWSKPIIGIGGNTLERVVKGKNGNNDYSSITDDAYKMAYTDALSISCKMLGIGGDVWWVSPNESKYTANTLSESGKNITCAECKQELKQVGKMDAPALAKYTTEKYGKQLCGNCAKKAADKLKGANENV